MEANTNNQHHNVNVDSSQIEDKQSPWLKRIAYIVLVAIAAIFIGWLKSSSVPECSDKEVKQLIREIFARDGLKLLDLTGIATKNKEKRQCKCTAIAKYKDEDGDIGQFGIEYLIELADNNKEFTVNVKPQLGF